MKRKGGVMKGDKLIIAAVLLLMVTLGGCSLNSNSDPRPTTPQAGVAFFHAAPASPGVDVIMDNVTISATAFTYGSFSGYLPVTPGSRSLRFTSVGDHSTQLDTSINVLQDVSYSFVLYNKGSKCKSIMITDVPQTFASTSAIMIRFLHVSPDTPAVKAVIVGETKHLSDDTDVTEVTDFTEYPFKNITIEVRSLADDHVIISTTFEPTTPHQYFTVALTGYQNPPANNNNKLALTVINNN